MVLYCIADYDFTKLQRIQNRLTCVVTKSPPFIRSVPLLRSLNWFPREVKILFKITLLTNKCFMKNSLLVFSPCLPHHSHPLHSDQTKELVCQSLGPRQTQAQELFTLALCLFGTTFHCLSVPPFQLLPSRNISRQPSLAWHFSHRHQLSQWPVAGTELLH